MKWYGILVFLVLVGGLVGIAHLDAFASSEIVIVDAGDTETLSFYLKEGDKIQFQVSVDGGRNDDINVKIKNPVGGVIISGRITESFGDTITAQTKGNYIFEFDNEISVLSSKRVDFTYEIIKRPIPQAVANTAKDAVGGCLIATATYGSELSPQVQMLREIRDDTLLNTESGKIFMNEFNTLYYSFSPQVAQLENENPIFKEAVKLFITPMIATLSLMTLAQENSEFDVIFLGVSTIGLIVGMYVVAPVAVIYKIKLKYS